MIALSRWSDWQISDMYMHAVDDCAFSCRMNVQLRAHIPFRLAIDSSQRSTLPPQQLQRRLCCTQDGGLVDEQKTEGGRTTAQ